MRTTPLVAPPLLALLALAGCFEEARTVRLVPGGAGTLQLEVRIRADLSQPALEEGPERIARDAARGLAAWEGVDAWSDVEAGAIGSQVAIRGTAWFEDANALRRDGDPFLTLRRDGQVVTATVFPGKAAEVDREPAYARYLDLEVAEASALAAEEKRRLEQALTGFRLAVALELPAIPERAEGFLIEGRVARFAIDGPDLRRELAAYLDRVLEVTGQLHAGAIDREGALALLLERERELAVWQPRTVTWTDPPVHDPVRLEFERRLEEVRAAWESSPWRARMSGK